MSDSIDQGPRAYVRLTEPAIGDLRRLLRKDPQIVRWAFKRMLLLERDPEAGEPLVGGLVGWRKITAGDRDWRVVWRLGHDTQGAVTLTISEVWAIGARTNHEVYAEMLARIAALPMNPTTTALAEVVELFSAQANLSQLSVSKEPAEDPVPVWLRTRLIHSAHIPPSDVDRMTGAEAIECWERHLNS